jgi:hypothetical protein
MALLQLNVAEAKACIFESTAVTTHCCNVLPSFLWCDHGSGAPSLHAAGLRP